MTRRPRFAELLTDNAVLREARFDQIARKLLGRAVGDRDRRCVRLRLGNDAGLIMS